MDIKSGLTHTEVRKRKNEKIKLVEAVTYQNDSRSD
jgi:hypothetical protein